MDGSEISTALRFAKEESEAKEQKLRDRIERAKRIIAVAESQIGRLDADLELRCRELTRQFLNLPTPRRDRSVTRRHKKGSLDVPVLEMIRTESNGTTTVPEACDFWNERNPDNQVGKGTMRGVLDRLKEKRLLVVVEEGNRGRSNLRIYRHHDVKLADGEESTEATAH